VGHSCSPLPARRGSAFTLIELMVAISLSIVLIYGLYVMFHQASQITTTATAGTEISSNARHVLQFIQREVSGAYTSDYYQHFMWVQDKSVSRGPRYQGQGSAQLSNSDDGTYGRLVDPNRPPNLYWRPGELVGQFVRVGSKNAQVRLIRKNGELDLRVDPPWDSTDAEGNFSIPRNTDKLLFFTHSAPAWGHAAAAGMMAETLVMFFIDDPALGEGQGGSPRRPPSLKAVIATRRSESNKFELDLDKAAEVGRYVTDLNIEYGETVWDDDLKQYRFVYRQCDTDSVGTLADPGGKFDEDNWALAGQRFEASDNYPADPSSQTGMLETEELRPLLYTSFDPSADAVRFRGLPAALRVTIRVTDRSGEIAQSYSQVMQISQGIVTRAEED